jgi:protein-tyrosine phosphatase
LSRGEIHLVTTDTLTAVLTFNASLKTTRPQENIPIRRIYLWNYFDEFVSLTSAKQSYRTLFLSLADQQKLPAVFHCTTGKDRTGWAAAVLLTLLGVPKETVMVDFLRSNDNTLSQYKPVIDRFVAAGGERDIPVAIFGVKAKYLEASFDEMQKRYGKIENYFTNALGIDAAGQKVLRELFLGRK